MIADFFDTVGTVTAVGAEGDLLDEDKNLPRSQPVLLVDSLAAAWYRVQLARRFHNEAVAQTQRMRRKMLVRALRLHGHAAADLCEARKQPPCEPPEEQHRHHV